MFKCVTTLILTISLGNEDVNLIIIITIENQLGSVQSLSHVQLFATPWTTAYQAPPSMGFSRQEYWSGVPLPSPYTILESIKCAIALCLKKRMYIIVAVQLLSHV